MAFVNGQDQKVYDVHVTDDLKSHGTWEYLEMAFSQPHADMIFIWRRDGKNFTKAEANYLAKYVIDDMEDFISEGKISDSDWHQKIESQLVDRNSCLVLQWDNLFLSLAYDDWSEIAQEVKRVAMEEVEEILNGRSEHDRKLDIYEGNIHDMFSGVQDKENLK